MTTVDEDVEEGTSGQGLGTNGFGASPTKAWKGRRRQISEDELSTGNDSEDVPVNAITGPKKKKPAMTLKQTKRGQTLPLADSQLPTSGVSLRNYGPGSVTNSGIGNITDSVISNVGNNNSKNYHPPRSKTMYDGYRY